MLPLVPKLDRTQETTLRAVLDGKAKPQGSLGRLEDLAVQLGLIRNSQTPSLANARLYVFAGDHGLTEDGVSAYPSAVTAAMVATFLAGTASANAFARIAGVDLRVVDAGVDADLPPHKLLIDVKIRRGTRNAAREPALSPDEVAAALDTGARIAAQAEADGVDLLAMGEMGIGNSASAALLMHRLAPAPLDECVGAGAGHDAAGLARKRATLARAASRSDAIATLDVLAEFGGLEIVMMAGAIIGAAAASLPVLIDGFIGSAAALAAIRLQPSVAEYCLFSHCSAERGHRSMLAALGATPLLDLGLRLGEGTGALLAVPIARAAAALLTDVASLRDVLAGNI
jgi:nicotinate-nucleotide--dimethylbenzimidazole phosphoribosyltransferase